MVTVAGFPPAVGYSGEPVPDIRITTPGVLVIVEVKVEAVLAGDQAESYLRLLESASDAASARRLVLLTPYPAPSSVPDQVYQVRWFQIADALETLADEGLTELSG